MLRLRRSILLRIGLWNSGITRGHRDPRLFHRPTFLHRETGGGKCTWSRGGHYLFRYQSKDPWNKISTLARPGLGQVLTFARSRHENPAANPRSIHSSTSLYWIFYEKFRNS